MLSQSKKIKKAWKCIEWYDFTEKVKQRDNYQCIKCNRNASEITLQVHHEVYRNDKLPWEYALSDCVTLCKGCHAREHNLIEPNTGWSLIAVDDLGDLIGNCERINCNKSIRYEHLTYHPNWGYKIVGSTCIEHLTQQDKLLSSDIIKTYKQISNFITTSSWDDGLTKKKKKYLESKYKHHLMRIYSEDKNYSFQIIIKKQGARWFDHKKVIDAKNKGLEEVKELVYIALRWYISQNEERNEEETKLLKNIYKNIKSARNLKMTQTQYISTLPTLYGVK
jgi:hypothetical protein